MNEDDPERRIAELERQLANQRRIAELERQLAEARAAAGQDEPGYGGDDEHARRYAQSLLEGLRTGGAAGPEGPSGPEMDQLRQALQRAAADAGMSQAKLEDALQHANVTIKTSHSVVYPGNGPAAFGGQAGFAQQGPRRKSKGADRIGAIIGMVGGLLGVCVGGAAALTAVFPSSALWMSPIVCRRPYELAYNTSHYSYKPGQSGTSVSFQCVSGADAYDVNSLAIGAVQSLFIALVVGIAVVAVRTVRGRLRNNA
ncbi:hypothetical protein [Mycobacterium angelicum]|uniref:Uncharacterized protein n=1 Tax=Mycobacterium angelicum TaxID=470074 RepID=A0A1W9ZCG6_MYCAN|nr:hypothetical protein [Mycobacterium angelicum]MCV7195157.1 hypothetical protein [Mycobacterium angelicum]ORA11517.1 hypothetical protein BST12_25730 [Mycobacterium angelicum]